MNGNYEVGFGKPPKRTRFRKGESGNPKGRPKGTKNLKTDLLEELQEQIQVREGSRERRLSKQRALLKSLAAKAIKGDPRSANIILNLVMRTLEDQPPTPVDEDLVADDREIIEAFKRLATASENPQSRATEAVAPDNGSIDQDGASPRGRDLDGHSS